MIAIKGLEMPRSCDVCPFIVHGIGDSFICRAADRSIYVITNGRQDWCPLIEIPDSPRNPEDAYREDFGGGTP